MDPFVPGLMTRNVMEAEGSEVSGTAKIAVRIHGVCHSGTSGGTLDSSLEKDSTHSHAVFNFRLSILSWIFCNYIYFFFSNAKSSQALTET